MTGRGKLRADAEHLRAYYARVLAGPDQPRQDLDAERIEQARRRIVREQREHGQLQLDVSA